MTSTDSPKARPTTSAASDQLTPSEIALLREQKRQLGRDLREILAREKAEEAAKGRKVAHSERQRARRETGSDRGDDEDALGKDSKS